MKTRLAVLALVASCASRSSEAPAVADAHFHGAAKGAIARGPQFSATVVPSGEVSLAFPSATGPDFAFTLAPVVVARGNTLVPTGNALAVEPGGDVRIDHGAWRDHLRSSAANLEQSWEFSSAPAGEGALRVRVPVRGGRIARVDDEGFHFSDGKQVRLAYGHATWVDARRQRTAIRGQFNGAELVFEVPVAVLNDTTWPAVLDPTISPEIELDVPTFSGSSKYTNEGAIAFGDQGYLSVWTVNGIGADGGQGILGARVLLDGGSLDPIGFVIADQGGSGGNTGYYNPDIAFATLPDGGPLFLTTWEQHFYGTNNVLAARIVPNWAGSALVLNATGDAGINGSYLFKDTSTDCGSNGCYARPVNAALGSSGNEFLIAWDTNVFDPGTDGLRTDIEARRIPFFGTAGSAFKVFTSTATTWGKNASVAGFASGEFVVAWTETNSNGYRPRASIVASSGSAAGTPIALTVTDGTTKSSVSTACTTAQCILTWDGDGPMGSAIYAERFDATGVSPDMTNPMSLGSPGTVSESRPLAAASASDYLVSWGRGATTFYNRITTAGAVVAPALWSTSLVRDIATSGGWYGAAAYLNSGAPHVRFTGPINPGGGVDVQLCLVPSPSVSLSTAWDGRQFRTAWYESPGAGIKGNVITGMGLLGTTSAPLIESVTNASRAALTSADAGVLLLSVNGFTPYPKARWLRADGGMNAELTLSTSTGVSGLVGASTAARGAASAWKAASGDIVIKYMASDYSVILPANPPVNLSAVGGNHRSPALASNGADYQVVWQDDDGGVGHLAATRVSGARVVSVPGGLVASADQLVADGGLQPAIASDGTNYLLVWRSGSDLWSRIIDSDGGFLSEPSALVSAAGDQSEPALTFDGTNYLLVWTDSRNVSADVYGTQVTPGGLAQGEFIIAGGATAEFSPSVSASSPGVAVVTYLKYDPGNAHQTNRARARVLTFGQFLNAYTQFITTPYDTPVNITLTGTLADGGTSLGQGADGGDALAYMVSRLPTRGTVSGGTGSTDAARVYTPTSGLSGFDSFDYYVTDGLTSSLAARINVQVLPPVDAGAGGGAAGGGSAVDAGPSGGGSAGGGAAGGGAAGGGSAVDAGSSGGGSAGGGSMGGGSGVDAGSAGGGSAGGGSGTDAGVGGGSGIDAGSAGGGSAGGGAAGGGSAGGGSAGGGSAGGGSAGGGSAGGGSFGGGSAGGGSADAGFQTGGGAATDGGTGGGSSVGGGSATDSGVTDAGSADDGGTGGGSMTGGGSAVGGGSTSGGGSDVGGGAANGGGAQSGGGTASGGGSEAGGSATGGGSGMPGTGCSCQASGPAPLLYLLMALAFRRRRN